MKYFLKHLSVVNKHKLEVFKLCCKCGYPIRGIAHDLSKYSYTEFSESLKYIKKSNGKKSPLAVCKEENGYSKAWLHHFGRNKHHYEYWYDPCSKIKTPIIPFEYMVEMICDRIAASKIYNKGNYNNSMPYNHLMNDMSIHLLNPKLKDFLEEVFLNLKENGEKILNKKNLKKLYKKHTKNESYY
jgi:hypothetical protein